MTYHFDMNDLSRYFIVSHRNLIGVATLFWYGGCVALSLKAASLLIEAEALKPQENLHWLVFLGGIIVGILKGEFLFKKSWHNNVMRINSLGRPHIWQCFRPRFFFFMGLMIMFGATLSRLAHNNYTFLIIVAGIDLSIAAALLWSSRSFWK